MHAWLISSQGTDERESTKHAKCMTYAGGSNQLKIQVDILYNLKIKSISNLIILASCDDDGYVCIFV